MDIRRINPHSISALPSCTSKIFATSDRRAEFVALREGDIDWKAVHKALADVGYKGTATLELNSGDAAYLKDVSQRFEMILNGA